MKSISYISTFSGLQLKSASKWSQNSILLQDSPVWHRYPMLIWAHPRMKSLKLVSWVPWVGGMGLGDVWGPHPTFFGPQPSRACPQIALFGTMLSERAAWDGFIAQKRNINVAARTPCVLVMKWESTGPGICDKLRLRRSKPRKWTPKSTILDTSGQEHAPPRHTTLENVI